MKMEYTFLHVDTSEVLLEHFQDKFTKLLKFEMKPMDVQVVFSMERHECIVNVRISEGRRHFKAVGSTNDFYLSVDSAIEKLHKQMSKEKKRLKDHKNRWPASESGEDDFGQTG